MPTPRETWHWRAVYVDDTFLDEHDERGQHGWAEVDVSRLSYFVLVPLDPATHRAHVLRITGDARPIFFRRRCLVDPADGSGQRYEGSIAVLGTQRTVHGTNVRTFAAFHEDGSVIVTDDSEAF